MLLVSFRASVWLLQVLVLHFLLISRIQDMLQDLNNDVAANRAAVLLHPGQGITSCTDGGSTASLLHPWHSWGDISTMRSLLTGYIFLQVFPRGLLVTLWFLCKDFCSLMFPFPRCPDVAPPQDLHAGSPSAVRATVLGMFVMGKYCSTSG